MKNFKEFCESTLCEGSMPVSEFISTAEKEFYKSFPKGWFKGDLNAGFGESVSLKFGIQPESKFAHNIRDNDPAFHIVSVFGVENGEFQDTVEAVARRGGGLMVKPAEGSYKAFDRVKLGWRKKKGSPEQVLKHITNYFKKMKKVVDASKDQLAHDIS